MKNIIVFYLKIFILLVVKFSVYLNRRVFVMWSIHNPCLNTYLRHEHPEKLQIYLRIRTVWSETFLRLFWTAKDAKVLHASNEDSDQTARVRRLILVFVGRTCPKVSFLTLWLTFWVDSLESTQSIHTPKFL